MLSLSFYPDLYKLIFDPACYHCLKSLQVFNPACMLLLMFYSPDFQEECGIYQYYTSVNLHFAELEYAYIRNMMVVPYIIYFTQSCTVYVGLTPMIIE